MSPTSPTFKLVRVRTRAVLGLPDVDVTLRAADGSYPPICITGPSGSGKTRLFEAILAAKEAFGAYGLPPQWEAWLEPGTAYGFIELTVAPPGGGADAALRWGLGKDADPVQIAPELRRALAEYDLSAERTKLEYMDASRRVDTGSGAEAWNPEAPPRSAIRISRSPRKYAWVRSYLVHASNAAAAAVVSRLDEAGIALPTDKGRALTGFARTLELLSPRLRWGGLRHEPRGARAIFQVRGGGEVELSELSDGELALVLYAAAYDALGLARSIVLVDLPELYLHPEDHARVFQELGTLSAGGQLIVATCSPAILRSVPRERVVVLDGTGERSSR